MSNNTPLTTLERKGLIRHHLPTDTPSQLSDAFRLGMAFVLSQVPHEVRIALNTHRDLPDDYEV